MVAADLARAKARVREAYHACVAAYAAPQYPDVGRHLTRSVNARALDAARRDYEMAYLHAVNQRDAALSMNGCR